jgi:hypothetical protein
MELVKDMQWNLGKLEVAFTKVQQEDKRTFSVAVVRFGDKALFVRHVKKCGVVNYTILGKKFKLKDLGIPVQNFASACKDKLIFAARMLDPRPVYMSHYSRDCDLMEVTVARKFKNYREARKFMEYAWENTEGAEYFSVITREAYEEFQTQRRDLAAEQAGY